MPQDTRLHRLTDVIAALREETLAYPMAPAHYVSDAALFGLAVDVLEQSIAVDLLRTSEVPRAAFANARAAFEAGLDILYLTADEAQYDHFGCLARIHEIYEDTRLQSRYNRANIEGGLSPQHEKAVEEIVKEDAEAWDRLIPGCGSLLLSAHTAFRSRKSGERKHWTGLAREAIALAVAKQLGGDPGVGRMYDAMYGSLSSQSHPRMRLSHREVSEGDDGSMKLTSKPADKTAPATAAAFACVSAVASLKRRRGFFADAA